jgi:hypothetical protein
VAEAVMATWPPELWVSALEVAYVESGWNPNALADTTGPNRPCNTRFIDARGRVVYAERSIGLFQINTCVHPEDYPGQFYDPVENARKAYEIYERQGWYAWLFAARELGLLSR